VGVVSIGTATMTDPTMAGPTWSCGSAGIAITTITVVAGTSA